MCLIHEKINFKAKVNNHASKRGDILPYHSRPNQYNYAVDISYWGTISEVGDDPENSTFFRNYLCEFSEFITN